MSNILKVQDELKIFEGRITFWTLAEAVFNEAAFTLYLIHVTSGSPLIKIVFLNCCQTDLYKAVSYQGLKKFV